MNDKLPVSASLQLLEAQVDCDLNTIRFPDREWVIPAVHPGGHHVHDVVVVGAGQCGLAVAFALLRKRITNIAVFESEAPGRQGPWSTYGRMPTLRSPKHFNGPDLDIPSLTCEAWYSAVHGPDAWEGIRKIPNGDWQAYLLWFRKVTGLPVTFGTTVDRIEPEDTGLLRLTVTGPTQSRYVYARKVIFATGVEGAARWKVPAEVSAVLPPDRYSQVAQDIDFAALAGQRIGVLGGGASAYDNASVALERGAASVDLFFRRPELHRVNPHKWTEFAGFLDHFRDLPDEWRWRFMTTILPMNEPPPPETFRRATRHHNFSLHLGQTWEKLELSGDSISVLTQGGRYEFDHLFIAIGLAQDLRLSAALSAIEPGIARWADRYTPPGGETNPDLGLFPYLGRNFEFTEREPGTAPYLRNVYYFTGAATVSHGPSGASINGMKQAALRIADGICHDFFTGAVAEHYAALLAFDVPELDVPWPA
jgi:FAD-dependent urate hydroxylase